MLIKWGAFVTEGRGKIGGTVASRNRSGAYMRNKVTPLNPSTIAQSEARSRLADFSTNWRNLTEVQRTQWNSAAMNFPRTNVFGDVVVPTGKNLYTRLNINLELIGESAITTPPTPAGVDIIRPTDLVASGVLFDFTLIAPTPVGAVILVFATPPVSPGVSFVKSEYRLIGTATSVGPSPETVSMLSEYESKFGTPVFGQKIFAKFIAVNPDTGETGVPVELSDIAS